MRVPRRTFLAGLGAAAATAPFAARAQDPLPVVAFLSGVGPDSPNHTSFLLGMADLGYVEGRDFVWEPRFGGGAEDRLLPLAEELVALEPDVIVSNPLPLPALVGVTTTIPIVSLLLATLVDGFVGDIRRPKGNVTGVFTDLAAVTGKQFELAKDVLPTISRVGLINAGQLANAYQEVAEAAVAVYGWTLITAEVLAPEDIRPAFEKLVEAGVEAVVIPPSAVLTAQRPLLIELAAAAGIPSFHSNSIWVGSGGLAGRGRDGDASWRIVAALAVKVLEGAKPGDLPVEVTGKYNTAINLNTARDLGIEFPLNILALADTVIELGDSPADPDAAPKPALAAE